MKQLAVLVVPISAFAFQLAGCAAHNSANGTSAVSVTTLPVVQREFWERLQSLCGRAFEGRLVESNAGDSVFARSIVVMHVRECSPSQVRVPLHVGEDRSRTWVITPVAGGLRLKHDHRHRDGAEDSVTQYGGDTRGPGTGERQEFHADSLTATLIPAARTNIWTIEIAPGSTFAYGLRREGRRFRVEFDLGRPVAAPPPPWGAR